MLGLLLFVFRNVQVINIELLRKQLGYPVFELISRDRSRDIWMESKAGIMAEVHQNRTTGRSVMWKTGSWAALLKYLESLQ